MGIYIDMEMPKPGEVIRIYNNSEARRCRVTEQKAFEVGVAIPVPPHGDLIDRDALKKKRHWTDDFYETEYVEVEEIDAAPTVIPAEEGRS